MARGYVAIKERVRRNQEVAAVKGDYFPGRPDLSSTWNADERSWKKRVNKEERAYLALQDRKAQEATFSAICSVINDLDKRRGYVGKRLGKRKAAGR